MITGIGVDIESVNRFKGLCKDKHFLSLVFTKRERDYCQRMKEPHISYAGKFCAKEAVMKANSKKLDIKDIEIINASNDKPEAYIKRKKMKSVHCSISHTKTHVIAFAVIEK
ncbi:holo-ACP synthase [Candidatus Woesearchaeota archaeon]|nr:holo-ACP synthase [Candidatus Woesearchaeota archaeon]